MKRGAIIRSWPSQNKQSRQSQMQYQRTQIPPSPVKCRSVFVCVNLCQLVSDRLTFRPLDAGVLVVTQKEALSAAALIAAHHVDTNLLASAVAFWALVHICQETHAQKKDSSFKSLENKTHDLSNLLIIQVNHCLVTAFLANFPICPFTIFYCKY